MPIFRSTRTITSRASLLEEKVLCLPPLLCNLGQPRSLLCIKLCPATEGLGWLNAKVLLGSETPQFPLKTDIFFQGRLTGQEVHEKLLNISDQEGNANQNHNEMSSHTFQNSVIKKTTNNKYYWGCGKSEPLCTVGGHVYWCGHYGKQYGGSSKC